MRKKLVFAIIVLLAAVILSGCSGGAVRGTSWPGLAADENRVYLADGPFVYAVNLADGKELWHYPASRSSKLIFYASPAITPDGLVIVGSAGSDHSLVAINPNDVNPQTNSPIEAWKFTGADDHWVAAPLVVNDKLFAVNSDGNLYILDLQDGQSVKKAVKTIDLNGRLWAQPVTDGQRVFVTSLDHNVIAIDAATYEVLWNKTLDGAIPGSPLIANDGMLYVGSLASKLEKFDPATGNHQSVLEAGNWIWSTASLEGDTIYFGDLDGNFYSFDTAADKSNWKPIKPDGPITASPLIQDDHILVATESGTVYAVDGDGKVIWSQPVGGKIYTTPVAAGNIIIVAPLETDFYLAALDQDGHQVWTFAPGN
jgi:outer membrane protein assembly factor BamB